MINIVIKILAQAEKLGCIGIIVVIAIFMLVVGFFGALAVKIVYWIFATFAFNGLVQSGDIPASLGWIQSFWIWLGLDIAKGILFPSRGKTQT